MFSLCLLGYLLLEVEGCTVCVSCFYIGYSRDMLTLGLTVNSQQFERKSALNYFLVRQPLIVSDIILDISCLTDYDFTFLPVNTNITPSLLRHPVF